MICRYLFRFLGIVHSLLFFIIVISGETLAVTDMSILSFDPTVICTINSSGNSFAGITVSKHIPSGITIGQRILSRLIAICVICGYSTLVGATLYLVVMKAVWTLGYPKQRLLLFDGVVVIIKDVIPMFLILYFTAKRQSSGALPPATRTGGRIPLSTTSFLSAPPAKSSGDSRHNYTKIEDNDNAA